MKSLADEKEFIKNVMDMLEGHFGSDLEIVLHDLTNEYAHSIVDIRNGHITNREVGGCGTTSGLQVMRGTAAGGNSYNEIMRTEDGKLLRCSTIYIKDDDGAIIGSICINQDITKSIELEKYLNHVNRYQPDDVDVFPRDVNSLLDKLIQEAQLSIGKHYSLMNKEDKLQFIKYLDDHGSFLITKSGTKICNLLNISKYTLYNYLDIVRNVGQQKNEE